MSRTILHVIEDLKPESGGPTTVVVELAREQARAGHRVTVACLRGPALEAQQRQLEESFAADRITLMAFDRASAGPSRRAALSALQAARPDVLHLHGVWSSVLRWSAQEARRSGIKYVISTHGMLHPDVLKQGRAKKWVYLTLFHGFLGGCSEILALNGEERDYAARRWARPTSVLPNGIRSETYGTATPDEFRRMYPEIKKSFALFLGRLHPIKGIDLLLRSFAQARAAGFEGDLVVAGPDGGSLAGLRDLTRELGVSNEVHFIGPLYGAAKLSAFAACSMFVHRPRFEGFGLTVIEALAVGRPVVTTDRCRLDGAVDAGALIMTEDSDASFADAMVRLEREPLLAAKLAERGRDWVRRTFDWASIREQADRVYERACSSG